MTCTTLTRRLQGPKYPRYYPIFKKDEKWPALEYFDHQDRGKFADPTKPNLLAEGVQERILSPFIGSELRGVQLSQLSPAGLDELALHVAQRKVVVLRDQDFKDIGPERQVEIANYFGPIHRHPTSGNIEGFPEFHVGEHLLTYSFQRRADHHPVVYRDASHNRFDLRLNNRANHTSWHSDVVSPVSLEHFTSLLIGAPVLREADPGHDALLHARAAPARWRHDLRVAG